MRSYDADLGLVDAPNLWLAEATRAGAINPTLA